ncbi:MAG: N-acetyltransferase [Phycisphaeraceae bacterium]|nr:N-acetyltransferase [Phycisphaerales bacterium]MCB9858988.1 N-acetyltransferase [Phycisphaeraceae bacterium]
MRSPRLLTPEDADAFCELRRRALVDTPWAFIGAPGDDPASNPVHMKEYLAGLEQCVAGMFDPDEPAKLVSVAGISRVDRVKARHRAYVWGVYTDPAHRGRGYGKAVMRAAIDVARSWDGVEVIGLSASANSPDAVAVYQACGFAVWGVEKDAIRLDAKPYDEVYMQLDLM